MASALLSSRGRVVTVDPGMVEMLGGTPMGWDLCEGIKDRLDLAARAQSIIRTVARQVSVDGEDVHPTLSIGGAIASGPGATPEAVLKEADTALFEAKRQGRACYRIHQAA